MADPIHEAIRAAVAARLVPQDPHVKEAFRGIMKTDTLGRVKELNALITDEERRFERWSEKYLAVSGNAVGDAVYTQKLARHNKTINTWEDIRDTESEEMNRQ